VDATSGRKEHDPQAVDEKRKGVRNRLLIRQNMFTRAWVNGKTAARMPGVSEGIRINQITAGHAKEFHEKLKANGTATTTIHKQIPFVRKFMHDAVNRKIIDENPFCKVKTQKSSVKVNEFVFREIVDKLIKKANPVWQVILGLSRYGGLRTPSETLSLRWEDIDWEMNRMSIPEPKVEHHEGRGIRSCPIFPELRPVLDEAFEIFGDKSEYVVAAPPYRAAANTAMDWRKPIYAAR
jgi:integrase